jgi:hypothetical protein
VRNRFIVHSVTVSSCVDAWNRNRFIVDNFLLDKSFPQWQGFDMERIGDLFDGLPKVQALAKATTPHKRPALSPRLQSDKFVDAALAISEAPDKVERAYMARQLVQCTLPHSNPGNLPLWTRRNGNYTLSLQAGAKDGELVGYPYGVLPRLLMFWMVTEAVQTKSRKLALGPSLSAFMRELGLVPSSAGAGKRSDAKRLRDQMERLFSCRITFDIKGLTRADGAVGSRHANMEVASETEYWWSPKDPEQGALWGSWVELGEKFFQAITEAPIPADMRALRLLKRSPLALDLYTLSIHKAFIANKHKEGQFLAWASLGSQLGAEYDDDSIRQFRAKVKSMMRRVHLAFPAGLKYELHKEGMTFLPGTRLPVPPRSAALA